MIPELLLQIKINVVTLTIGLADHSADAVDQIADFVDAAAFECCCSLDLGYK